MPESDDAGIRRRPNELSCPQTFGEISHIPRGDRDSATTFGGVLDPLRSVIGCAAFPHRIGQRVQSRRGLASPREWPHFRIAVVDGIAYPTPNRRTL